MGLVPAFSPMLARSGSVLRGDGWAVEPKLDGWRALVRVDRSVHVLTRHGRDITGRLGELQGLAEVLDGRSATFDGELVAGRGLPGDFYRIAPELWSRQARGIAFAAFDVLELDGQAVICQPYSERRRLLEALVPSGPAWTVVPSFTDDLAAVFVECVRAGLEGVVAKRCGSRYHPGKRSSEWMKAKAPAWREFHAPRRHR